MLNQSITYSLILQDVEKSTQAEIAHLHAQLNSMTEERNNLHTENINNMNSLNYLTSEYDHVRDLLEGKQAEFIEMKDKVAKMIQSYESEFANELGKKDILIQSIQDKHKVLTHKLLVDLQKEKREKISIQGNTYDQQPAASTDSRNSLFIEKLENEKILKDEKIRDLRLLTDELSVLKNKYENEATKYTNSLQGIQELELQNNNKKQVISDLEHRNRAEYDKYIEEKKVLNQWLEESKARGKELSSQLATQVSALNETINMQVSKMNELTIENDNKNRQIVSMKEKLTEALGHIDTLKSIVRQKVAENVEVHRNLQECIEENSQIKHEQFQLNSEIRQIKTHYDDLHSTHQRTIDNHESNLKQHSLKSSEYEAIIAELKDNIKALHGEIQYHKNDVHSVSNSHRLELGKYEQKYNEVNEKYEALQSKMRAINDEYIDMKEKYTSLHTQHHEHVVKGIVNNNTDILSVKVSDLNRRYTTLGNYVHELTGKYKVSMLLLRESLENMKNEVSKYKMLMNNETNRIASIVVSKTKAILERQNHIHKRELSNQRLTIDAAHEVELALIEKSHQNQFAELKFQYNRQIEEFKSTYRDTLSF